MICEKCGKNLESNTTFCPECGTQARSYSDRAPVTVNTWLVPAILATIFCCLPFGIVSIVFASKANSAVDCGNPELAMENAAKAKMWFWISFFFGIFWSSIITVLQVIGCLFAGFNA